MATPRLRHPGSGPLAVAAILSLTALSAGAASAKTCPAGDTTGWSAVVSFDDGKSGKRHSACLRTEIDCWRFIGSKTSLPKGRIRIAYCRHGGVSVFADEFVARVWRDRNR